MKRFFVALLYLGLAGCNTPREPKGMRECAGYMSASCTVTENWFINLPNRSTEEDHWTTVNGHAYFCDMSGRKVDAGKVKLNGVVLRQDPTYHAYEGSIRSAETQKLWRWQVEGSRLVPTIGDSLTRPYIFRIASPRAIDTISKSKGFTIRFSDPGVDTISIGIMYDSMRTSMFDNRIQHSFRRRLSFTVRNTGSCFIPGDSLALFPSSGMIQIGLWHASQHKDLVIAGRRYAIDATTSARTFCFIKS